MIVVSDTSPITNLAAIGQLDLVRQLYAELHIPTAVWDELNAGGKRWPGSRELEAAAWVQRHSVQDRRLVDSLTRDLDRGEAESIVLALELGAHRLLLRCDPNGRDPTASLQFRWQRTVERDGETSRCPFEMSPSFA